MLEVKFRQIVNFDIHPNSPLSKRIFLLITKITIFLGILGNIINITMGMGLALIIVTYLAVAVVFVLHIKVKRESYNIRYAHLLLLLFVLIIPSVWILNAGYNGNTISVIIIYLIGFLAIYPPEKRKLPFSVILVILASMILLQYMYPDIIIEYQTSSQRFADLFVGNILTIFMVYLLVSVMLDNYQYEQDRLRLKNEMINELNKKIKKVNTQLTKTNADLDESLKSKDRFIAILAHDLRSPFQSILGLIELLEDDTGKIDNTGRQELLCKLHQIIGKQHQLLEELLLWGKLQQGNIHLNKTPEKIREIIEYAAATLQDVASVKNIKIRIVCPENIVFNIDNYIVIMILRNLISNAVKFSHRWSEIVIQAEIKGPLLEIRVSDNGVGISPESLDKLFRVDEYVSTPGTANEKGTGLGLLLSYEMAKKHNGSIQIESKVNNGTTAILSIS